MRPRRSFAHVQRVGKYKSKMEYNYSLYLTWLQKVGEIDSWEYESTTFWFNEPRGRGRGIKRGVVSYKPDFIVCKYDRYARPSWEVHEVKGWLDPRSKTKLKRMCIYYPEVPVKVIDSKQMAALKRQVGGLCGFI